MTLRRLFYLLLAACVIGVPSNSAQCNSDATDAASNSSKHRMDLLLQRESEALDEYQHQVDPAIHCGHADKDRGRTCHDMRRKIRDESQQAKQEIALYQASNARQLGDLFNIYVDLESLLKDIEIFAIEDEFNGNSNHDALAQGDNSFVKLTDVWFKGEMKKMFDNCR